MGAIVFGERAAGIAMLVLHDEARDVGSSGGADQHTGSAPDMAGGVGVDGVGELAT